MSFLFFKVSLSIMIQYEQIDFTILNYKHFWKSRGMINNSLTKKFPATFPRLKLPFLAIGTVNNQCLNGDGDIYVMVTIT